jgi:1-deoxy-D-xylulose-5-phosphate synthase
VRQLAAHHEVLITIEEGAIGGFATQVLTFLAGAGLLESGLKIRPMTLPDRFIEQDSPAAQYDAAGLYARHFVEQALRALGHTAASRPARA